MCPSGLRHVFSIGPAPDAFTTALHQLSLTTCPASAKAVGAACIHALHAAPEPQVLRRARLALGRRGRLFIHASCAHVPLLLLRLTSVRLEPKRLMLVHRDGIVAPHAAFIVALAAKPGGLEIHLLNCDGPAGAAPPEPPAPVC